jgi:hypothetical protein
MQEAPRFCGGLVIGLCGPRNEEIVMMERIKAAMAFVKERPVLVIALVGAGAVAGWIAC